MQTTLLVSRPPTAGNGRGREVIIHYFAMNIFEKHDNILVGLTSVKFTRGMPFSRPGKASSAGKNQVAAHVTAKGVETEVFANNESVCGYFLRMRAVTRN